MRKIVAGLFLSLDGVYESPDQWHFPYFNDEMGEAVDDQMAASDAMLLGRVTYQEFASFLPGSFCPGRAVCGPYEQHAQVRRFWDPGRASREQLDAHQRQRCGRDRQTKAATGQEHREHRQRQARPVPATA